jgi:hypothetical protein
MNKLCILVVFGFAISCAAKETTVGGRIRFDYDEARWAQQPASVAGAAITRLADDEGDFTVLVMREKAIAGGMGSAESRRKFIEGLSRTNAKAEEVTPIEIFGRSGFEFVGRRQLSDVNLRMRIVLIVDDGDVLILVSSAPDKDPMSAKSISDVWRSIKILKRA